MHPKTLLDSCAELLRQVLRFDHPADMVLSRYFREFRLGPRERATLAETIYGVLRKKNLYTYLAQHGSGPLERRLSILGFAGPRDFLLGALSDQEKDWLARCDQVKPSDLMELHRHNLPQWLVEPLKEQLGDDFWPLVDSLNAPAGLDMRVNTLKDKRADIQKELAKAGLKTVATPYSPWGLRLADKSQLGKLDAFTRGAIEVQDEGSQLLALLVDAKRGEMVVDFCAGAGGKTLALGASMRNTGRLYAFDTSAHRLDALKPRLARSGLSNVHPVAIAHERDDRIKRLAGKIDRVLVDAPCSGLGTLRRNPDLKWRQNPKAIEELTAKQTAILQSSARLLKPGGRLVYATCSVLRQENEGIAEAFTAANKDFQLLEIGPLLTHLGVEHSEQLCRESYLRLWPHLHHTDGFFAAVWQKL
ncbi:MAG: SAM-dependent methyltransferase [Polaromonas sp. 39-63-203]|jgi:16S rRNA (cytosine967-C5)-methyltransferase|uniref:RsmB/NOP family class I SAM-dependent RNA methyltransferase n=1 Tax=Polaromonas sp. TaxID=1869339 RepID=UPI000BD206A4|nr:RsmB/NOP family class I SAM-dependent RNA methyltransferase [Polaromonas sp.]OYY52639.1 MAG: SAM-dependent methyltransferase [Polaromonas sp. 35-63-240]OYY98150.1 MAG: SAM-dependent methyltransferase [Polaromonas sp. 28-63-22]OYZ83878.1 MAG: SAM-dependent methyltransferase [Polaromonas sp. 24-62-144]OZA98487.1 MAG: SAM-dependent methyltransferase [Polaromonas sp. 39-63-203]HQS32083.1 RsmB/NOP family class I SAM-dependent RNA methyltransferase [Polaromonas sp.]